MPSVASNKLAPAKMAETAPKKGAELISADLGAAGGLQEPVAMVDETGFECQGWAAAFGLGGHHPSATGRGAAVGFDVPRTPGEPHCTAIWPQFGDAHEYF